MAREHDGIESKGASDGDVPEGFTLSLALMDALPVILFCLATIRLGQRLDSPLFVIGASISFCAGLGKVLWKLFIAVARRRVDVLARQMRYLMPVGFAFMIVGALTRLPAIGTLLASILRMPASIFLIVWLACMVAMGYMAAHRIQDDARSNWIEQGVNTIGQAAFLIAVLLG